jgi:hypothetical protein
MTQPTRSADGETFTLFMNGEQRTYTNDKAGKRQAIIDGLNTIETITAGEDEYLPNDAALQVVAAIMYPDGIQTEKAYELVCRTTAIACDHIGYGDEVQLGPPLVPFPQRGTYRQKRRPLDPRLVLAELEQAGTSSYYARQEIAGRIIWNKVGLAVHGRHWSQLDPGQQAQIQTQTDEIVENAGWQIEVTEAETSYIKPLPVNIAGAKERLHQYLSGYVGRPIPLRTVHTQAQLGAYGRAFYADELAPELETAVSEVLQAIGYHTEPTDGEYRPAPVEIFPEAEKQITERLAALDTVMTEFGPALLLRDVLALVKRIANVGTISEWQAEQLVQTGVVSQALRQQGFKAGLTWCQPYHFQPPMGDDREHQVILKEVRVQNNSNKKLSLAKGLPVYTPAVVLDRDNDNIIYLEIVGNKQAVRANWAALVGKKVCWIGGQRIDLDGMKEHVMVRSSLPCGWVDHILIHKQASIREMNPEEPFFLLDDGRESISPLFYPMLNKCLAMPVLEEWAVHLWENGRARNLVTLLNDGEGQGYAAWRVLPAPDEWQNVIQNGLQEKAICF